MKRPRVKAVNGPVAVLTGDLIGSRGMTADHLAAVRDELSAASAKVGDWAEGLVLGGPDVFRGDAWQLAISDPRRALRVSIFLRARLLALTPPADTRIAIGLGGVERLEPSVSQSVGEAFLVSGGTLDSIGRGSTLALALTGTPTPSWVSPMLSLVSTIVGRWKPRQALVAALALSPEFARQSDIAEALGLSPQGVSDHFVSAGVGSVLEAVELVEATDWSALMGS